jgi:nickel transport protein
MKRLLLLIPAAIQAHDLQVTWQRNGPAVIVENRYAGTEAAAYAAVEIFSPADARQEFQNGRTDAAGRFSFVPDRGGEWRYVVDDEIGHRVEVKIPVGEATFASSGIRSPWMTLAAGLGVIAGVTGVLYGWKARRES